MKPPATTIELTEWVSSKSSIFKTASYCAVISSSRVMGHRQRHMITQWHISISEGDVLLLVSWRRIPATYHIIPRSSHQLCHMNNKQTDKTLVMGKSIRIDSRCRIVMKNYDSVPQLQRFSYTCITVLQDHVMAHILVNVATRFCKGN